MDRSTTSAVFDSHSEAERAIEELRRSGVRDEDISVLSRKHDELSDRHDEHHDADTKASGAAKGLGIGAGLGAVAGLAFLVIPGAGPFMAAGAIGEALGVAGSAAATSAAVGGAIGGVTGALMDYGVDEKDAHYYNERIEAGGVWVGVETSRTALSHADVDRILHAAGLRTAATVS